jgi:aryl-alcohol dehydrogenase-like predicted oxidoreductase
MNKVALGSAQFGLDYGLANSKGKISKKEVFEILNYAYRNGINTIDTASVYGDSEEVIGEFIGKSNACINIISKLPSCNFGQVERIFRESLERLCLPNIYGYLIHDFNFFLKNINLLDFLRNLKAQNKIEKIGFSLYYPSEISYLLKNNINIDLVQVPYNIFDQRFASVFPLLKRRGIEIHVRSIFLQGLVFKNALKLEKPFDLLKEKLSFLQKLSKEKNIPISALCIIFAYLNEDIDKIIIGIDNLNNLKENCHFLKYINKTKKLYGKLFNLKENNEKIILPVNWRKQ